MCHQLSRLEYPHFLYHYYFGILSTLRLILNFSKIYFTGAPAVRVDAVSIFFYVGGSRLCQHFHDPFTSFKSWELCYQTSTPRFLVMGDTTSSGFYPYNNSLRNVDYNQGNGEVEASQNSFLISSQNGCLSPKRLLPSTLSI